MGWDGRRRQRGSYARGVASIHRGFSHDHLGPHANTGKRELVVSIEAVPRLVGERSGCLDGVRMQIDILGNMYTYSKLRMCRDEGRQGWGDDGDRARWRCGWSAPCSSY